jgi:hypothetical protein
VLAVAHKSEGDAGDSGNAGGGRGSRFGAFEIGNFLLEGLDRRVPHAGVEEARFAPGKATRGDIAIRKFIGGGVVDGNGKRTELVAVGSAVDDFGAPGREGGIKVGRSDPSVRVMRGTPISNMVHHRDISIEKRARRQTT